MYFLSTFEHLDLLKKLKKERKKKASLGAQVNKTIHDGGVFFCLATNIAYLTEISKEKGYLMTYAFLLSTMVFPLCRYPIHR